MEISTKLTQYSEDNTNWFSSSINTIVTFGSSDFEMMAMTATSRYYRLSVVTSGSIITATLAGK